MSNKIIPITILTGFLGAGKTTLVNEIIKQNPDKKFGLIINEFGEEGVDGSLIQTTTDEEIVEMSNGCLCCVARGDLIDAANKLIQSKELDYILIETSGLAEPMPIAQTFMMDNLDGKVSLDAVVCLVDAVNHNYNKENFRIAIEQIIAADIIVLNKLQEADAEEVQKLKNTILEVNPYAFFVENNGEIDTNLLIDSGRWTYDKVVDQKEENHEHEGHECDGDCEHCEDCEGECDCKDCEEEHSHHEHHHHEHHEVDEFVYTTEKKLDMDKFQEWVLNNFPKEVVRSKGFIRFNTDQYPTFLFQMVGAKKVLMPFAPTRESFNATKTRIVFIGKNLDETKIKKSLSEMEV